MLQFLGESVVRAPDGRLVQVNGVFRNLGETQVYGFDFGTSYVLPTERMGRFDFSAVATWTKSYKISNVAGVPLEEVIGTDSTGSGDVGYLEWRGRVQAEWTMGNINAVFSGLYTDSFLEADPDEDGSNTVRSTWVFDTQINYTLFPGNANAFLADTKITLGAKNVFNTDPPFVLADFFNSTGYPGFLYNAEGRFVYLSLSKKL